MIRLPKYAKSLSAVVVAASVLTLVAPRAATQSQPRSFR